MDKAHWRNQAVAFLALASIKGVGFWTMHKLAGLGYNFKSLLKDSSQQELQQLLKVKLPDKENWEQEKKFIWSVGQSTARDLAHQGIKLIFPEQDVFPTKLKAIHDAPRWLFVQGSIENLFSLSVAVVGTRKPSEDGCFLTKYVLALLSDQGLVTVSGLAAGIDRIVHEESLRYGISNVAVLGNGFNIDYPKGSIETRKAIVMAGGTVISEYLPSQVGNAETFVRRNRLQAGLAETVIPVEWRIKSGTAHTVRYASNYGSSLINVYLPGSMPYRDEILFSEKKYSAISFMVPQETLSLLEAMRKKGKVIITSPSQISMTFSEDEND